MKIIHLISVDIKYATKIFLKECSSLAKVAQYDIKLITIDNKGINI